MSSDGPYGRQGFNAKASGHGGASYSQGGGAGGYMAPAYGQQQGGYSYGGDAPSYGYGVGAPMDNFQVGRALQCSYRLWRISGVKMSCLACSS